MKSISRRIRKLEARLGPPVETAFTRRLRQRLEEGRRRLLQWREQEGISVSDQDREDWENLSGLTVTQILHRGRARVRAQREEIQWHAATDGIDSRAENGALEQPGHGSGLDPN
jgi:hypothetical protein